MKTIRWSIVIMFLLIVVLVLLAGRCFYLQFYKADHYQEISLKQLQKYNILSPQRGVVLDHRGVVLAASNKVQTIFADPRIIPDTTEVAARLAPILDKTVTQITTMISEKTSPGFAKLQTEASLEICDQARKTHPGVDFISDWRRQYPAGSLACHVVGFFSKDNRPLGGIELQYNKYLEGSSGKNTFLIDNRRNPIRLKEQNAQLSDGCSLILTIDSAIQQFTRQELYKQYKEFNAKSATAIVADPKTGEILAMVSLPDFEPENFSGTDQDHFRNRALTDPFEPGSILKPFAIAIGIDAGVISKNEKIFCENGDYYDRSFGRINEYRNHGFGNLTPKEILVKSSNIGMAKIGQKLGKEKLYQGLKRFGFGQKTGIDLPGEDPGLLNDVSKWTSYSVTRIPYGYEIAVTPIQIVKAFCMLANGGRSVNPYLVKAVIDYNGKIVKLNTPAPPIGYVIKPEIAKWMVSEAMVAVVNEKENGGTGWRAKLDKWQVFGKTGTANIARVGQKGYHDSANNASFIAGAPAEDPQIVVMVLITKPDRSLGKGDSGGAVASPVAARIIEKTLKLLNDY